jgi:hypothetical protein
MMLFVASSLLAIGIASRDPTLLYWALETVWGKKLAALRMNMRSQARLEYPQKSMLL